MTEARQEFAYLDEMDPVGLEARRQEILSSAPYGDYMQLGDEPLTELWAIMRALRRKAATPSGRKKGSAKQPATLEDLA